MPCPLVADPSPRLVPFDARSMPARRPLRYSAKPAPRSRCPHPAQPAGIPAFPLVIGLPAPRFAARFSFLKLARGRSPVARQSKNRGNSERQASQPNQPTPNHMSTAVLNNTNSELSDLIDSKFREFKEGTIVKGTIIEIRPQVVLVDIGYKSEGTIMASEFEDEEIEVGDEVEVLLEKLE